MSGLFLSIFQYKVHLGLLVSAYESITIDELKEQTNNSLDRVTEEQHPLRVFMNDGKCSCCSHRICSPQSAILIFA